MELTADEKRLHQKLFGDNGQQFRIQRRDDEREDMYASCYVPFGYFTQTAVVSVAASPLGTYMLVCLDLPTS